jgi:molybdenum cofactor cytidylyltransferase
MSTVRSFAVVPAAGLSQRMGQHKLLLPWQGATVMDQCLQTWTASRVTRTIVVVRAGDQALIEICQRYDVDLIRPDADPPDMKRSVQYGLNHACVRYRPDDADIWLMAPADMPGLRSSLIDRLLESHEPQRPRIVVPTSGGKRGHPTLFPWPVAAEVLNLRADQGVNTLLRDCDAREIELGDSAVLTDLDTRDDYQRLQR